MDAFEQLAAGAIAGMQEVNGRPLPQEGDWIHGVTDGQPWSGVCMTAEPNRVSVDCGFSWIAVSPADLLTVAPGFVYPEALS